MFKIKKILSVIFISLILISVLSFSAFAAGETNLVSENLNNWQFDNNGNSTPSVTFTNNENRVIFRSGNSYSSLFYNLPNFTGSHDYTFSFKVRGSFQVVNCYVLLFKNDTEYYFLRTINSAIGTNLTVSLSFNPNDYFDNSDNLKIGFLFQGNPSNNYTLVISDLLLIDNTGSISDNISSAIINFLGPSQNFIINNINQLFSQIESHWYLLFIWYLFNSGFIIFVVVNSVWNWVEIASEGTFDLGLMMLRKNKFDRIYDEKSEQRRKEAEERYLKYKTLKESSFNKSSDVTTQKKASYDIEKAKERDRTKKLVYVKKNKDNENPKKDDN